ncbi:aliphatic sulfonate ABC transporter substrate-binding protein [Telmatospirillum siberiense]|uniref:Putative aliphatic sulfonates-binding protein n=2 Tax=Telmatospirillum siberiense TaxID=382514 RepID=A0A2N3PUE1_9PROT|nr:aliphatic sulfonate ABC transporter substrate-binding protein [Telmatospirillum siberiense]
MAYRAVWARAVLGTVAALGVMALGGPSRAADDVLRIGFQKSSSLLVILKGQGTLEKALAPLGVKVEWHEFSSGLPLLEGVNVGSIDLSADVADTVPLFAQAAGADLTYLVQEKPSPTAQAIVVAKDSPIKTVSDLKGRKIGVAKAAGAHYLTLQALERSTLPLKDVEIVYLQPADGRAAFEKGAIDAWAIWDPFLATVRNKSGARVLTDGSQVGVNYRRYYLAATPYVQRHPDVLKIVVDELVKTGTWIKAQPREAAQVHAPLIGLDVDTVEQANSRRSYAVALVDDEAVSEQQRIADAFLDAKLLPKKINVRDSAVWTGGK